MVQNQLVCRAAIPIVTARNSPSRQVEVAEMDSDGFSFCPDALRRSESAAGDGVG